MKYARALRLLVLPAFLVLVAAPRVHSQGEAPKLPTADELQARITELAEATDEEKVARREAFRQALEALKNAEGAKANVAELEARIAEAPAQVDSLRAELAKEVPAVVLDPSVTTAQAAETKLQGARAELDAARTRTSELEQAVTRRSVRRGEALEELASLQQDLARANESLATTPPERVGRQALYRCQIEELTARQHGLELERDNADLLRDLAVLRRDQGLRTVAQAEAVAAAWEKQVATLRAAEGAAAEAAARAERERIAHSYPVLETLAERIHEIVAMRSGKDGLAELSAKARQDLDDCRAQLRELRRRQQSARTRVNAGGLTEAMGQILRSDYEWIPPVRTLHLGAIDAQNRNAKAQIDLIDLREERGAAGDPTTMAEREHTLLAGASNRQELLDVLHELSASERDALEGAIADLEGLTGVLTELEGARRALEDTANEYRSYIEQRILWVRSSEPNPLPSLKEAPARALDLADAVREAPWLGELGTAAKSRSVLTALAVLTLLALLAGHVHFRRKLVELGGLVRSYRTDSYRFTVRALVLTSLLAAPGPLAVHALGWLLSASGDSLVGAAGFGLRACAEIWLVLSGLRVLLMEKGVGAAHFRWPAVSLAAARVELRWLQPVLVVLLFVVLTLDRRGVADWVDSLGRPAFVLAMIALSLASWRLLGRKATFWGGLARAGETLVSRTHRLWSAVTILLPAALGVAALAGYSYTALQFSLRLRDSIGLTLLLLLAHGLLLRWLFIERRRLAVAQVLEARERRAAEAEAAGGEAPAPFDADRIDIPAIDTRTRKLFRSGITLAMVLGLYFLWASVLPALQGLDRVQLWPELTVLSAKDGPPTATAPAETPVETPTNGSSASLLPTPVVPLPEEGAPSSLGLPSRLTLADVLQALIFAVLTAVAVKNLPALLELAVLQRLPLDSGARYAVSTIVRYAILLGGVSAVSGALGVGWKEIQWLAAALTFGLAFGLQEIFANFVSGLIILIERPIRVGDIVTVGDIEGRVTELRMRSTTILDWDRRELLVPNKEFITDKVINWTLSDPVTRIIVPVGIAYGSDTALARKRLLAIAKASPYVLAEPAPYVVFRNFGESSLDFELRAYIGNRDLWPEVIDSLHDEIDKSFRQAGIEIAFPQRDLHVRSVDPAVREVLKDQPGAGPS